MYTHFEAFVIQSLIACSWQKRCVACSVVSDLKRCLPTHRAGAVHHAQHCAPTTGETLLAIRR